MANEIKGPNFGEDDEPVQTFDQTEYCPICENHGGHSLSCATFHFNRIDGDAQRVGSVPMIDVAVERESSDAALVGTSTELVGFIPEAIDELASQTGVTLSEEQMERLLAETGIGELILDLGEVETQVRESLADALSNKLVGRDWPMYGERSSMDVPAFIDGLHEVARKAGYQVG